MNAPRITYQLYCCDRPGYVVANWEYHGGQNDLQFRQDMAREYGVGHGEGYFTVKENGVVINKLDIPL